MANTTEDLIKQMYESQLASQKEQLQNDYAVAESGLDAQKQQNQKAADANLRSAAVASQKSAVSNEEYYAAAGLTSGAKAQARLAQENQLQSDLTAIRTAQQEADAETERQRALLSREYTGAIRQAQAENDLQKAQALYEEAKEKDAALLQQQKEAAAMLGAAGDFSLHGTAYGLTADQIAALDAAYGADAQKQQAEEDRARQEAAAALMAQGGDYSRYGALYGLSADEVKLLNALYAAEAADGTEGSPEPAAEDPVPVTGYPGAATLSSALSAALGTQPSAAPEASQSASGEPPAEHSPNEDSDGLFTVDGVKMTAAQLLAGVSNGTIVETTDPRTGAHTYTKATNNVSSPARPGSGTGRDLTLLSVRR